MVFLGIEKGTRQPSFSGRISDPVDFVRTMRWSFLNGIDRDAAVYEAYQAELDQYMVVGRDGRLEYVSPVTGFEQGAINIPALEAAIDAALARTPVASRTWTAVKRGSP